MRQFRAETSDRFKQAAVDGWSRMHQRGSDIGQLVYYFDSAHFVDYLDRYKSPNYERNVEIFRAGDLPTDQRLVRKQWEKELLKKKAANPV